MSARSVSVAALFLGLSLGAAAEAGGSRVGVAVVVPFGPMTPIAAPVFGVPVAPVFIGAPVVPAVTTTILQPMLAPSFVPGFVPVLPQPVVTPMVVAPMVVAPMVVAPAVPMFAAPAVIPHVPMMAPGAPLFFAPPVQTVISPSLGGQVIIIRGSGF
jgi:hypothetical protein